MKFKTILILIILAGVAYFFYDRKMDEVNALENLELEILRPKFKTANSKMQIETIIPIKFKNTSELTLNTENFVLEAFSKDVNLGKISKEIITLQPGEVVLDFPLTLNMKETVGSLPKLLLKDDVIINLKGQTIYRIEGINLPITVPLEGEFKVKEELLNLLKSKITF